MTVANRDLSVCSAHSAPPVFDIACALEYAAPFRDNSECLRWLRYPPAARPRPDQLDRILQIAQRGLFARIDPVRVDHDPGFLSLPAREPAGGIRGFR